MKALPENILFSVMLFSLLLSAGSPAAARFSQGYG
jgi:hypothetical protein